MCLIGKLRLIFILLYRKTLCSNMDQKMHSLTQSNLNRTILSTNWEGLLLCLLLFHLLKYSEMINYEERVCDLGYDW